MTYTLRDFVIDEMNKRGMSNPAFGEFIGVSHSTINRIVDPQRTAEPTLEFLFKLSTATGKSLLALLELAYPETVESTRLTPTAEIFAQRFVELSDDKQRLVIALLRDLANHR